MMNAGSSRCRGRHSRYAQLLMTVLCRHRGLHLKVRSPAKWLPPRCWRSKAQARSLGREIQCSTVGWQVICRPTQRSRRLLSARHYRQRRLGRDRRHAGEQSSITPQTIPPAEYAEAKAPLISASNAVMAATRFTSARPDKVADELATTSVRPACAASACRSSITSTEVPYFCKPR